MVIFNSYVKLPEGKAVGSHYHTHIFCIHIFCAFLYLKVSRFPVNVQRINKLSSPLFWF